ncbi:VCBS repeat-containing protein [Deltaproteobacteria bacterium PRO3]|nr:VCBS repeat-containing protein [Deltaproteobacteria bacterium PRO3]
MRTSSCFRISALSVMLFTLAACGGGSGGGGGGGGGGNQGLANLNFGAPTSLVAGNAASVPAKAQALYVGDFTGDQKLDFAVLNTAVGVFVGNGNGTFQNRLDATSLVTSPSALAAGEFDGQPNVELAATFPGTTQVDIYFDPNRDGQFADNAPFAILNGSSPEGLAIADFTGDGKDDIAVSNSDGSLTVKVNTGSVTFNDFSFSSAGKLNSPRNVVAGDFNGDGRPDLAFANFGGDSLTVWMNSANANPAFLFPGSNADNSLALPTGAGVQGVTAADFNGDGKLDLVAANPGTKNGSVFLNQGNGTFGSAVTVPAGADAFAAAAADFNLDGKMDLVIANAFGVNGVDGDFCVYLGKGDGTFDAPKTFTAGKDAADQPNHPRSVAVGDFNGDGKPDLVMAGSPGDTAIVVLNTSN